MSTPYYVLAASVPEGGRLRGFMRQGSQGVSHLIENPPSFRWGGFDLRIGDSATLVDGSHYEVRGGNEKVVQLYQDGTLLFRAAADSSFLGWGLERAAFEKDPRLNPVAVVECHAAFVHLYAKILEHFVEMPGSVLFRLVLRNTVLPKQQRLYITKFYKGGTFDTRWLDRYPAHNAEIEESASAVAAEVTSEPNVVAFSLVERVYAMFDAGREIIPFTTELDGKTAIDVAALQQL